MDESEVRALRRLAVLALSLSAAVFAAEYLLPLPALPWLAGLFGLAALLLALFRRRWLLGFALAALGLAMGFLCFAIHAQRTLLPAQRLDGETVTVTGEVSSYPRCYDAFSRLELRLETEGLPSGRILLYADGDLLSSYEPGDRISCMARLSRTDVRYGERYDSYLARGVILTGSVKSDPILLEGGHGLRSFPLRVNHALSGMVDGLFPEDTAAFMKSLMLGDKSDLYEDLDLYLAMSRAGFLHIVAVSGMHIAFLVGLIQLLFGRSWRSSLFCLLLLWSFVLVTGSSPSAVRAAVMQSFLLIAPLVRRENDPITSLSAALALLLLLNPFAAGSVSLHLSFSAMAGILCLAEPLQEALSSLFPEHWAERLRGVIGTVSSTLAVLAFSVPFMAWHFRSVSILSPITNALGLWAVSCCFCGGYLSCLLGFLFTPLGRAAAWLLSWLARYLFLVAHAVSSLPFAVLYLRSIGSYLWIVLVYLLVLVACLGRLRPWLKLLMPLFLSGCMLALLFVNTRSQYRSGEGVISVIDVGQGQSIAVLSGDETLVIDCGGILSLDNAGEETGSYLLSCGRDHIDALLLTHLHSDHCNGVTMLMEMLPVQTLILPADIEDTDGQLAGILQAAERCGTTVTYLREDEERCFGSIRAQLFAPLSKGGANERCMTGLISLGTFDMLFTGDSSKTTERALLALHPLENLELLIVGHHGSRYASSGELLSSIGAHTAVISVGYNTFGHPTNETLERLAAYGYTIYRTDLNGTLEFFIGS